MAERQQDGLALPAGKLLEGIVTTQNADGSTNIAPMGPIIDADFSRLRLRPFQTSTTYHNLKRSGEGVLHVADDVELFARAAINRLEQLPRMQAASAIDGMILSDACRWYAFRVESLDDREERTEIIARVVDQGRLRDFFGFNRAKHAVIEAAILASRVGILDAEEICSDMKRLALPVEKTGGQQERTAFALIEQYLAEKLNKAPGSGKAAVR